MAVDLELKFPDITMHTLADGVHNTLDDILDCISEEELFEYYVGDKIIWGQTILSPLRDEKTPSFVFYKGHNNKPTFYDFGTGIYGDIFTYLQLAKGLSFTGVVRMIISDFNRYLNIYPSRPDIKHKIAEQSTYDSNNKNTIELSLMVQNFSRRDIKYWESYGISLKTLKEYNVVCCTYVTMKKDNGQIKVVRSYSKKNPVYAFKFGTERYKIYCPLTKHKSEKWMGNHTKNDIEGFNQLPSSSDLLVVTKSMKDVMLLYELGYHAISLHSETNILSQELHDKLKHRFQHIVAFYDNDVAGRCGSLKMFDTYHIPSIEIPPNKYGDKDISDYYHRHGFDETQNLMTDLMIELYTNSNEFKSI